MFFKNESDPKHKEHIPWLGVATSTMVYFWRQDESPQFAIMERLVKRAKPEFPDGLIVQTLLEQADELSDMDFDEFQMLLMRTWRFSPKSGLAIAERCSDMIVAAGGLTPADANMLAGISLAFQLSGHDLARLRSRST